MFRSLIMIAVLAFGISAATGLSPARAQNAVPDFGGFHPLPDAGEQPDPAVSYEVIFDVTLGGPTPDKTSSGLERVARFVNLLAAGGVDPDHRRIVAVVHGGATRSVITDTAYGKRFDGIANPNTALVAQLVAAGVEMRICGQAMTGNGISVDELLPDVHLDLAALMTVVHFQQRGYVLIAD